MNELIWTFCCFGINLLPPIDVEHSVVAHVSFSWIWIVFS